MNINNNTPQKGFPMFFFPKTLPVANVLSRGPLDLGSSANIDCVNALEGKKNIRLVSVLSFLLIVGISPKDKYVLRSLDKFLVHPTIRSKRANSILERLHNGYVVKDIAGDQMFVDYRIVTDFCRLMLSLRRAGKLRGGYLDYATNCEMFMLALADVGLAALIDEATGYDKIKKRREYQELFKDFIREEHSDWVKEFPNEFFEHLYRVYHCERTGRNHPSFFAHVITKYIYWPLADSHGAILEQLREKDPIVSKNGRRYRLHQFLTEEVGKTALRLHIGSVITLLALSNDKGAFKRIFARRYPKAGDQMEFNFDEV